jgi:transcriptional regulator with XRE-family HTH domain
MPLVTANQLHAARILAGLEQQELAERAGINRATVSLIERGEDTRLSTLNRIVEALEAAGVELHRGGAILKR